MDSDGLWLSNVGTAARTCRQALLSLQAFDFCGGHGSRKAESVICPPTFRLSLARVRERF